MKILNNKKYSIFQLIIIYLIILLVLIACKEDSTMAENNIFEKDNLYAWCIVPFDKLERTPLERIEMLKNLGIKSYGYDWRNEHLATMEEEFLIAKKNNIAIECVWMWIDSNYDKKDKLSEWNEELLKKVQNVNLKTTIWLGFHENYFQDLSQEAAMSKGVETINYISNKVEEIECKLAFYNHGSWIGEPENQIKIIEKLEGPKIGIVYNFHHGHDQIEKFPHLLKIMMPYLVAVNINGMNVNGPKILPVGSGDLDKQMLQSLLNSGYKGRVGILGHVEEEDVEIVLKRNLDGLRNLELN